MICLSFITWLSILRPQILNIFYAVILKPQNFKSCSSHNPNMIAFIKSQTPSIDMDPPPPPYRNVRITSPGFSAHV